MLAQIPAKARQGSLQSNWPEPGETQCETQPLWASVCQWG